MPSDFRGPYVVKYLLPTNTSYDLGAGPLPDQAMETAAQTQLDAWCVSMRAENVFLYTIPAERISDKLDEIRQFIWSNRR